jgi:hypothetical protein
MRTLRREAGRLINRPVILRTITRSRHSRTGITAFLLHLSTDGRTLGNQSDPHMIHQKTSVPEHPTRSPSPLAGRPFSSTLHKPNPYSFRDKPQPFRYRKSEALLQMNGYPTRSGQSFLEAEEHFTRNRSPLVLYPISACRPKECLSGVYGSRIEGMPHNLGLARERTENTRMPV